MSIIKLLPACKDYLWGGTRLKTEYNKKSDKSIIAETWELSCHPDGESTVADGEFKGKTLNEYINAKGRQILGENCKKFSDFPVLIKLIDAKKPLSVQVHPDDSYALENEGGYGKTEMWYIVDCKPESYIYYGFEKNITKSEFEQRIKENTLTEVLHKAKVKKGDVFFIEAGTIHAIGADILIAEIQQSSNSTYRVYDYGRVGADGKPRQLHIEKALDVTKLSPAKQFEFGADVIAECKYFKVQKIVVKDKKTFDIHNTSFHSLLVLDGEGIVTDSDSNVSYKKGDSIFIDAFENNQSKKSRYTIQGNSEIILTTIP